MVHKFIVGIRKFLYFNSLLNLIVWSGFQAFTAPSWPYLFKSLFLSVKKDHFFIDIRNLPTDYIKNKIELQKKTDFYIFADAAAAEKLPPKLLQLNLLCTDLPLLFWQQQKCYFDKQILLFNA